MRLLNREGDFEYSGRVGYDLHDVLSGVCEWLRPRSYLEVGVDGGESVLTVIRNAPRVSRIVLCDMWNPDYEHHGLRDHRYVSDRLGESEYQGSVLFLDGDSHVMLPQLRKDEKFDLITVDGDHSAEGARKDLEDTWPHLNLGGVLVFDDANHESYPWLGQVVRDFEASKRSACRRIREINGRVCNAVALRKVG